MGEYDFAKELLKDAPGIHPLKSTDWHAHQNGGRRYRDYLNAFGTYAESCGTSRSFVPINPFLHVSSTWLYFTASLNRP